MKPHNRKDLITKKAGCAYDPDGVAHRWEEFLEIFQPDETVRRFLQVYCGYALTGAADEQMLVFNYGHGANGKSTFMEAVSRALGQYARTLNAEAVSGDGQRRGDQATPEIAQLPGARLVNIAELPKGTYIKENLIKALTGGERMQARHLNKGFFDFYPSFKAMMSGNDKPQIQGTDHGIWRRIKLVHWPVSIDSLENFPRRKMSEVLAEFEAESAGILNWMLNGLEIYLTEGMKVPAAVEEFTQEYRDEVDVLGNFIASCIDRTGDPEDRVQARPMFEVYQRWAHENSITPCKETRFGRDLPEKGLRRESDRGRNFYIGVKLKPDWQPRDTDAAGDGREGPPVDAYAAEADSRPDPTSSSPPRTPDRE
jgi:putative DNA primase/helicase